MIVMVMAGVRCHFVYRNDASVGDFTSITFELNSRVIDMKLILS